MSATEILQELPLLSPQDLDLIRIRLNQLQAAPESPEMLEAIDAGRKSIREGKVHTIEEARLLVNQCLPSHLK